MLFEQAGDRNPLCATLGARLNGRNAGNTEQNKHTCNLYSPQPHTASHTDREEPHGVSVSHTVRTQVSLVCFFTING